MRFSALLCLVALAASAEVPATVTHVADGDTIAVTLADGTETKVRLLWVDTPESKDNSHGEAMPEGKAAAAFLRDRLPAGTKVTLWSHHKGLESDRYGRVLAVVWKHELAIIGAGNNPGEPTEIKTNTNLEIIRAGWSPYWRKYGGAPAPLASAFTDAQDAAKEANAGAWGTAPDYMRDKANETTAPKGKE